MNKEPVLKYAWRRLEEEERQNGYTGDFKGVMAYPVLLVQKGRKKE